MRSVSRTFMRRLTAAFALALTPALALAYVGPGAGVSMLGALWGLIAGVVVALGVILFWPVRILIRKMKANKAGSQTATAETGIATADDTSKTADNSPAS